MVCMWAPRRRTSPKLPAEVLADQLAFRSAHRFRSQRNIKVARQMQDEVSPSKLAMLATARLQRDHAAGINDVFRHRPLVDAPELLHVAHHRGSPLFRGKERRACEDVLGGDAGIDGKVCTLRSFQQRHRFGTKFEENGDAFSRDLLFSDARCCPLLFRMCSPSHPAQKSTNLQNSNCSRTTPARHHSSRARLREEMLELRHIGECRPGPHIHLAPRMSNWAAGWFRRSTSSTLEILGTPLRSRNSSDICM